MKFSGKDVHEIEVDLCKEVLAAHKREIAEKDAKIKQLRDALKPITALVLNDNCSRNCVGNGMCNQCDFYDSCEGEYVFSAVREAKGKALEIEKLKFDNMRLKSEQRAAGEVIIEQTNKVEAKDAEIASLRALVKEMADVLKLTSRKYFECEERMCVFCGKKCGRNEATRLINKAMEVCK